MANAITGVSSFTHTYTGREILEPIFYSPQLSGKNPFDEYQVIDNVKYKANIYIPGKLQKIVTADSGCGFSASGSATITDKVITPVRLKVNLEQCESEFDSSIFAEARKNGVMRDDLTGTIMEDIIRTSLSRGLSEDLIKLAWQSKSADSDAFYGNFDGFFQLIHGNTSDNGYNLDLDSTAFESGGALATDGAVGAMRQMYEKSARELYDFAPEDLRYYVTKTVADNLLTTYENAGTDSGLNRLEAGGSSLKFRGIPVVTMPTWDTAFDDSANPMASTIGDNAIVYTPKDNLVVASDITDIGSEALVWHDIKDEKMYTKVKFLFGCAIVHQSLITQAY